MSAKTRVLVVDDEAAILRFLKPALEANAYQLTSAGTVAEALKRIAAEVPDIVVLDLGSPTVTERMSSSGSASGRTFRSSFSPRATVRLKRSKRSILAPTTS